MRLSEEGLRAAVQSALLRVAKNVAKHVIQRSGWREDDECFQVDLREAEEEIMKVCREASSLSAAS